MTKQKIFGLIVSNETTPYIEKVGKNVQCYICGFTFKDEDGLTVFVDEELKIKKKVHSKCLHSHILQLPEVKKIAMVDKESEEILCYSNPKG